MIKIATILQHFIDDPKVSSIMKGGQLVQVFRYKNTKSINVAYFKEGSQLVDIWFKPKGYGTSEITYTGTKKDIDSLLKFIGNE